MLRQFAPCLTEIVPVWSRPGPRDEDFCWCHNGLNRSSVSESLSFAVHGDLAKLMIYH